ncbi:MAG: DUF2505 domain-containing protein [Galactobacter sp.]
MALSSSRSINAAPAAVFEALTSKANAEAVAGRVNGSLEAHTTTEENGGLRTSSTFVLPSDRLPDVAKKLMKDGVTLTLEEAWSAPAADGSRTSELVANVKSAPIKVNGGQQLTAAGEGTTLSLTGEVSSSIPFLGGKISKAAEPMMDRLLEVRCQIVEAQLG